MLPPSVDAAVEIAVEDRLLLLLGHLPVVEIGALVGLEAGAVLGLHQRHAELIEPVALARLLGVEDGRAGNFIELLVESHGFSLSFPRASRAASDCRRGAAPAGRPRRDMGNEVDQQSVVGHVAFEIWMRPVGAPQHAVRKFLDHLARERNDVAVGVLLAV